MRFNYSDSVMSTLRTGPPSYNDGDVFEGGCVKILIMSSADYRKESSNLTQGKGIIVRKRVTVSKSLTILVLGKQHCTHL